jgi:hypothetical protein
MNLHQLSEMPLLVKPHSHHVKRAAQYKKLSNNVVKWGQDILDSLYTAHQELNDIEDIDINWVSKDEKSGNAVGNVTILGKIAIPVIVEDFKLAPLDTMVVFGKAARMNPTRLKQALFDPKLFSGQITPQDERALTSDMPIYQQTQVNQWSEGRRVFAAYDPLIDKLLPTISETDFVKFARMFEQDPSLLANFAEKEFLDDLKLLLTATPRSLGKMAHDTTAQLPLSVVQLVLQSDGTFLMKAGSDAGWAPQYITLPGNQFAPTLQRMGVKDVEGAFTKAASQAGLLLTLRSQDQNPLFLSDMGSALPVEKFGFYIVKDVHGREHKGWVFPNTYTVGKTALDKSVFVGEKVRVIQDKIAGVQLCSPEETPAFVTEIPRVGDIGCFCLEGFGGGLALSPIKIASVEKNPSQGGLLVTGTDLQTGAGLAFHVSKVATDIVQLQGKPGQYLLPRNFKYFSLKTAEPHLRLVSNPVMATKMAAHDLGQDRYCGVRSIAGGRAFLFSGPSAEKIDVQWEEQSLQDTLFKLACFGLSPEVAEEVVQRALRDGEVLVGGLRDLRLFTDVVAHEKQARLLQVLATLPNLKQDTVKIAADLPGKDPETLDRLLALNFLNPQNISILIDHMEDLDTTQSRLSEMLLAARLGAKKDINEDAIIQARQAIDDVLEGLMHLKSRLGPQTGTTEIGGDAA